eukprot:554853-Pyramimonas_sp.AAC.1
MLRGMWTAWHRLLRERYACKILHSDCFWLTTAADSAATLRLGEDIIPRKGRGEGFRQLGAWITLDNCASAAVNRGISRAWAAF